MKANLNLQRYRDRVLGCWAGKNIGGTLGAPFEGQRETNDVTFYTQELGGNPLPNDDLDLQLVWLLAAEEDGVYRVDERRLAEYWLEYIVPAWNEYGVGKANMRNGIYPPLSGACNNERWKNSNGAWIRSEIWSCIFPGSPDEAIRFAWCDSCCDHSGEGIYAEVFTAALESAAFVISDIRELLRIALAKIPPDCRVAQNVRLVCELYDAGTDWAAAREAVVEHNRDLGFFQAPGNLGFVIIGLLYGEGDFGRSVTLAVNCGDDTDCTAATVGAVLGILHGYSGIPERWLAPIGNRIATLCVIDFHPRIPGRVPATIDELTDRVIAQALWATAENAELPAISAEADQVPAEFLKKLDDSESARRRVWEKSSFELSYRLPYGRLLVDYVDGIEIEPGVPKQLILKFDSVRAVERAVKLKLLLPDAWRTERGAEAVLNCSFNIVQQAAFTIIPGEFDPAIVFAAVEVRPLDRDETTVIRFPLQRRNAASFDFAVGSGREALGLRRRAAGRVRRALGKE